MADENETEDGDWLNSIEVPEAETETPAPTPEPETPADPEPATEAATETVETPTSQVPLAALKEEREKRQAMEREIAELRARVAQPPQQAQPVQRQKAPDPYEDPEGYDAYVRQTVEQTAWQMRAEMSGRFAEDKYGKETVEAAVAWAEQQGRIDPTLGQRVTLQSSPVEYVVQEYKRSQTLQAVGDKTPEEWAREYAVAQGWIVSQPGAEAPLQKPSSPTPPKSLSQAPGNGGIGKAPKEADWTEVKFALG